ncbi:MAG: AMP-binding protein [Candidatus Pacearchaeota archaeon]|jgi:long-chain acyl-CoA synthetase
MGIYKLIKKGAKKEGNFSYKRNNIIFKTNYKEFFKIVDKIAYYLYKKGLKKGDKLGIYLENSPEWIAIDLACFKLGIVVVPLPKKVSKDAINFAIEDSKMVFIIGDEKIETHVEVLNIELKGDIRESFNFIEEKEEEKLKEIIKTSDIATICYTSGSTGVPKGVILSHGNIIHNIKNHPLTLSNEDRTVNYLPLAHMFARTCDIYFAMEKNVNICFSEGIQKIFENFIEFKPTYFMSVPLLLDKVYKMITSEQSIKQLIENKEFDKIGFIVKQKFGGEIRYIISGGAPLSKEVTDFFFNIGIPVYQGYGLTETSPLIAVNYKDNNLIGSVGKPIKKIKVKISKNGTLLVKSPGLMQGYTKEGEKEKRMIKGWFDTGDVSEINEGFIVINGRVDDMILMANGKKVYPEFIEKKLEEKGLDQVIIFGKEKSLVALISSTKSIEDIQNIIDEINPNLSSCEQIKKFGLLKKPLSVEEGTLTMSLKKKRSVILSLNKEIIESL